METLESVFESLPKGCVLKNPNTYHSNYTCVYKDRTKNSVIAYGDTAREAVIHLAEMLGIKNNEPSIAEKAQFLADRHI